MKTNKKTGWLGAGLLGLLGLTAGWAGAAATPSSQLNIEVTITNNRSVKVDSIQTNSQTVGPWSGAATIVAGTTATVTNDSTYVSSRWELTTTANSFDKTSGAAGWAIAGSASADQVKLQAVFGAPGLASAGCGAANWSDATIAPALTNGVQTQYTQVVLADTLLGGATAKPDGASNNVMNAGSTRPLCWKLTMPTSNSFVGSQVVPVIVTAF